MATEVVVITVPAEDDALEVDKVPVREVLISIGAMKIIIALSE
jgi:hypothetical protein